MPSWRTCGWECGANKARAGRSGCTVTCHISHSLRHLITTRPSRSEPCVVGYELLQLFYSNSNLEWETARIGGYTNVTYRSSSLWVKGVTPTFDVARMWHQLSNGKFLLWAQLRNVKEPNIVISKRFWSFFLCTMTIVLNIDILAISISKMPY